MAIGPGHRLDGGVDVPGRISLRVQLVIAVLGALVAVTGLVLAAGERPDRIDLSVGPGGAQDLTIEPPATTEAPAATPSTGPAPSTTAAPTTTVPAPSTTAAPATTVPAPGPGRIDPTATFRARVVDASMHPQLGWCVQVLTAPDPASLRLEGQARTNADGTAVLQGLPLGRALVVVTPDCRWQVQTDPASIRPVELVEGWSDEVWFAPTA